MVRVALQSPAVAAAVIDEVEPRLLGTVVSFGRVEGCGDETREFSFTRRRIMRRVDVHFCPSIRPRAESYDSVRVCRRLARSFSRRAVVSSTVMAIWWSAALTGRPGRSRETARCRGCYRRRDRDRIAER